MIRARLVLAEATVVLAAAVGIAGGGWAQAPASPASSTPASSDTRVLHACFGPRVGTATRPFDHGDLARHAAWSHRQSAA